MWSHKFAATLLCWIIWSFCKLIQQILTAIILHFWFPVCYRKCKGLWICLGYWLWMTVFCNTNSFILNHISKAATSFFFKDFQVRFFVKFDNFWKFTFFKQAGYNAVKMSSNEMCLLIWLVCCALRSHAGNPWTLFIPPNRLSLQSASLFYHLFSVIQFYHFHSCLASYRKKKKPHSSIFFHIWKTEFIWL